MNGAQLLRSGIFVVEHRRLSLYRKAFCFHISIRLWSASSSDNIDRYSVFILGAIGAVTVIILLET